MEEVQPEGCVPEVSWEVSWESSAHDSMLPIVRRTEDSAKDLARLQRAAGFKTRIQRVERTEVDF